MSDPVSVVVLLRGINVGGKNKLAMADLREIAADCGFEGARTHVQSGNLVLPATDGDLASIGGALGEAITRRTGMEIPLILRTADEWNAAVAANPFPGAADDGRTLHVIFLDASAPDELCEFDAAPFAPDAMEVRGSEVYLHLPDGIGRSKLAAKVARLHGASTGTARNWNTVLELAALTAEA